MWILRSVCCVNTNETFVCRLKINHAWSTQSSRVYFLGSILVVAKQYCKDCTPRNDPLSISSLVKPQNMGHCNSHHNHWSRCWGWWCTLHGYDWGPVIDRLLDHVWSRHHTQQGVYILLGGGCHHQRDEGMPVGLHTMQAQLKKKRTSLQLELWFTF